MLLYDIPYIISGYFDHPNLYLMILYVIMP
jgi:hypothetical protein